MRRISLPISTDGAGDADVQTGGVVGLLHAVYVENGTLAATADITITDAATGHALLTLTDVAADALYMPRGATHGTTGAAALYAAGGTGIQDRIPVSGQIRVVVAQGGASASGTLTLYIAEAA